MTSVLRVQSPPRPPKGVRVVGRHSIVETIPRRLLRCPLRNLNGSPVGGFDLHPLLIRRAMMRAALCFPQIVNVDGLLSQFRQLRSPPAFLHAGFASRKRCGCFFQTCDERVIMRLNRGVAFIVVVMFFFLGSLKFLS